MLDLTSISFIILAMNYIALAGVFLLRYFNPKQWSIWLVKSSASYFVVYTITMFVLLTMFFVILLLPEIKLLDPSIFIFLILLGFLFLILVAVKKQIENIEGNIISPFLLYLFSVGQEIFYTVTSNDGMVLLLILIFWYFVGAFVILLLGKIIGYLLGKLMPKIAKEHFSLQEDSSTTIIIEDARRHLKINNITYELVLIDVFRGKSFPPHLSTEEFLLELKDDLAPDGVVIANLIVATEGEDSMAFFLLYNTFASVFENVIIFPLGDDPSSVQNIILIATDKETSAFEQKYSEEIYSGAVPQTPVLTDELNPIEIYLSH